MLRSPAVCCDVQGDVDIVSLPQSELYLTKLDLYAPASPARARRHEPRTPATSSTPTHGGGNTSRPAIHVHDSPMSGREREVVEPEEYAVKQDQAKERYEREEQRDDNVYIKERSAGGPLINCCGPPATTRGSGIAETGQDAYPGSAPSPTAPGMFDACCGPAGGRHEIVEGREGVSMYIPKDSKRDPFMGERNVSQASYHGVEDVKQDHSSCWDGGRQVVAKVDCQPQRSTEDVYLPEHARPDPFLGSYSSSPGRRGDAVPHEKDYMPGRPSKSTRESDLYPAYDRARDETRWDETKSSQEDDRTRERRREDAHHGRDAPTWDETRPSPSYDRTREEREVEGRHPGEIRDREQAVISAREDYALPGVQEVKRRNRGANCCGTADDESEFVVDDLASPLRKKNTAPAFCGAPPDKDESYVLTFPDETASKQSATPVAIPPSTNPVRIIHRANAAEFSDSSRHFRALQETGRMTRTIVAGSSGSCGLNMSAVDKYTCRFDDDLLTSEILIPAHTAIRESKLDWTSKSFMLLCQGRQPMHIRFSLSPECELISTVTAQLLDDSLRNVEIDCEHVMHNNRARTNQTVYTDKYNVLPGKTPVVVKNALGFNLNPQELSTAKEECNVLIIIATVSRPIGKIDNLVADFAKLYSSPDYYDAQSPIADVTLVCDREIYPATRAVLMARSQVFYQMLRNKSRAVIAVTGTTPQVVKNMVDYIHTDKCEVLTNSDDVPMMVKVHELAVRFNVASLRDELALALCTRLTPANVELVRASAIKTKNAPLLASASVYANAV